MVACKGRRYILEKIIFSERRKIDIQYIMWLKLQFIRNEIKKLVHSGMQYPVGPGSKCHLELEPAPSALPAAAAAAEGFHLASQPAAPASGGSAAVVSASLIAAGGAPNVSPPAAAAGSVATAPAAIVAAAAAASWLVTARACRDQALGHWL
jgi:hypothetical protein